MKYVREDPWGGIIGYDTKDHQFIWENTLPHEDLPNPNLPLVLNVDLAFDCNMHCKHCVAEDMAKELGGKSEATLKLDESLIKKINLSPFIVIVITGGEPLLPKHNDILFRLINGIKGKGIVIDTNGTIAPSKKLLRLFKKKEIMIRISWDIPHPNIETRLRVYPKGLYPNELVAMQEKENLIRNLSSEGICVGIQTVFHMYNFKNKLMALFPKKLKELGVKNWYLQRFIPSHKFKNYRHRSNDYLEAMEKSASHSNIYGVKCHYKKDKRHNSVFLLVCDGDLYTQSDTIPGKKILLGKIGEIDYFKLVSAPDHAARYFV
jgi:MoaA/NifB/PqqE/SkfB family radical SAM enzyme